MKEPSSALVDPRKLSLAECSKKGLKVMFKKLLPVSPLLCLCSITLSAATAYGQVSLDAQIQRLREGKEISISDADFLKSRVDAHDKFLWFAVDLYIEQIKWSLISPERHGG